MNWVVGAASTAFDYAVFENFDHTYVDESARDVRARGGRGGARERSAPRSRTQPALTHSFINTTELYQHDAQSRAGLATGLPISCGTKERIQSRGDGGASDGHRSGSAGGYIRKHAADNDHNNCRPAGDRNSHSDRGEGNCNNGRCGAANSGSWCDCDRLGNAGARIGRYCDGRSLPPSSCNLIRCSTASGGICLLHSVRQRTILGNRRCAPDRGNGPPDRVNGLCHTVELSCRRGRRC